MDNIHHGRLVDGKDGVRGRYRGQEWELVDDEYHNRFQWVGARQDGYYHQKQGGRTFYTNKSTVYQPLQIGVAHGALRDNRDVVKAIEYDRQRPQRNQQQQQQLMHTETAWGRNSHMNNHRNRLSEDSEDDAFITRRLDSKKVQFPDPNTDPIKRKFFAKNDDADSPRHILESYGQGKYVKIKLLRI